MSHTVLGASPSSIIDTSLGLLSTGGDAELLSELVSIFLQTVPTQLVKMKAAVTAGDSTTMRREAHSLKGAAGALGTTGIQKLAAEIEGLADKGEVETAEPLVASIEELTIQLKQEYEAKSPQK